MRTIFINLPVGDVALATAFYEAIGFEKNPDFSNDVASAMRWSDAISVMLLDHGFYATFTDKPIADTQQVSAALFCLSFDDRPAVDAIHAAARAAGGTETRPIADQQFMYGGAFEDPDGHIWETVHMDMSAASAGEAA
ncbi:VOC family protein [Sphingomonas phyllosphaerae]|uniref:VOC family protein n=1 Tax=Sphingomonas phyllosphaerae TaxID=257003 RepID=UPI00040AD9F2|nr:VOC family protein [Sphingomonas phyllosphaerae]